MRYTKITNIIFHLEQEEIVAKYISNPDDVINELLKMKWILIKLIVKFDLV